MGIIFVKNFSTICILTELRDVESCDEKHCVSKLDPQDFNIKTSLWAFKGYYLLHWEYKAESKIK